MTSVLIVDDETNITNLITSYLQDEGYQTYQALDGLSAIELFRRYQPEVVVLDIMLPHVDGLEVLKIIRQESEAYVLLLTARADEIDRVVGLTIGADDYITKPFSPKELVARIKAVLRRQRNPSQIKDTVYEFGDIRVYSERYEVWRGDILLDLTALEFQLVEALARHAGKVLTRSRLIEIVWGYDFYGDERVVDVHIGHIRQKLELNLAEPKYILTVRGVGYKFAALS